MLSILLTHYTYIAVTALNCKVLYDTSVTKVVMKICNCRLWKVFPLLCRTERKREGEHNSTDNKFLCDSGAVLWPAVLFSDYTLLSAMDAFQNLYIPLSYLLSGERETHGPSIKHNRNDNKIYYLHSSSSLPSSRYLSQPTSLTSPLGLLEYWLWKAAGNSLHLMECYTAVVLQGYYLFSLW